MCAYHIGDDECAEYKYWSITESSDQNAPGKSAYLQCHRYARASNFFRPDTLMYSRQRRMLEWFIRNSIYCFCSFFPFYAPFSIPFSVPFYAPFSVCYFLAPLNGLQISSHLMVGLNYTGLMMFLSFLRWCSCMLCTFFSGLRTTRQFSKHFSLRFWISSNMSPSSLLILSWLQSSPKQASKGAGELAGALAPQIVTYFSRGDTTQLLIRELQNWSEWGFSLMAKSLAWMLAISELMVPRSFLATGVSPSSCRNMAIILSFSMGQMALVCSCSEASESAQLQICSGVSPDLLGSTTCAKMSMLNYSLIFSTIFVPSPDPVPPPRLQSMLMAIGQSVLSSSLRTLSSVYPQISLFSFMYFSTSTFCSKSVSCSDSSSPCSPLAGRWLNCLCPCMKSMVVWVCEEGRW